MKEAAQAPKVAKCSKKVTNTATLTACPSPTHSPPQASLQIQQQNDNNERKHRYYSYHCNYSRLSRYGRMGDCGIQPECVQVGHFYHNRVTTTDITFVFIRQSISFMSGLKKISTKTKKFLKYKTYL